MRRGLAVLHEVGAAARDVAGFARAGVQTLGTLAPSDITTLSVCNLQSGQRQVIGTPANAIGPAERASFDRFFSVHPLVRYHADFRGQGAHRISDSLSWQRFKNSALYSEYYRRIGIDRVVALPVYVDQQTLVSFVLNRRGRDFSDHEVALLNLVRGHLSNSYMHAVALQQAQTHIAQLSSRLEQSGGLWGRTPSSTVAVRTEAWPLTVREREVLRWLAAGKADRDIAALMDCSPRTVQKHLERIYVKLGVENRTAAVMRTLGSPVKSAMATTLNLP
jgi:DNA-binding CsgD family transcriptional regulator